ncbi:HNH endonuclease [Variovorax sp. Varisp36]|uniref:HNH endonuclease n=1 Tax=Variovorax sp. Varisp36 TaxID=3243031 RepID=UPI0039A64436
MTPLDRLRLEKAGADCGFEMTPRLTDDGVLELRSAAFPETICISASTSAAASFRVSTSSGALLDRVVGDAVEVHAYGELYAVLQRASALARTMPNRVADKFRQEKAKLPQSTEAERLVVQRVGQGLFRDALLDYWQGRCCVTGLVETSLLRASHIKPWAKCVTDDERLDVFNGLLLAPHLDALFDGGWISFEDDGALLTSASLSGAARLQLGLSGDWRLNGLKREHASYLAFHRQHEFRPEKTA